jgi:protein-S-isoprenylcysteine O-methyltransferase Ste14
MPDLARKTVVGFVQLVVVLGIALFGPAGTLDYLAGWLYLFVFFGSAALITVYIARKDPQLLARRVSAGPSVEKQTRQKVIQALAGIGFVCLFILPAIDHRYAWSAVPLAVVLGADALVVFGFWIIFLVFRENTFASDAIEVANGQKVIASGPYARVPHPMYAGALLILFATPLALGSWWGLLLFIPIALTIVWRLLEEEKFLSHNLAGYREYCQHVRYRLIPLVW